MPTNARYRRRKHRGSMERCKWKDMGVICGPEREGGFMLGVLNDETALEYWESYGDEIVAEERETHPGKRPWAWWEWDHDGEPEEGERRVDYLRRIGELEPGEFESLTAVLDQRRADHFRDYPSLPYAEPDW